MRLKRLLTGIAAAGLILAAVPAWALTRNVAADASTTIGLTATQVLAADAQRGMLIIANPVASGGNSFWCSLTSVTPIASSAGTLPFPPGAVLILDSSVSTGPVTCIGNNAATLVTIDIITQVGQ